MRSLFRTTAIAAFALIPIAAFGADSFVPLTNIPEITDAGNSANIAAFLNGLYKLCIGIAVVLAVLQLIRAGITYMTAAGNVGSTEEAKHLISTALLGLLLVLSPYILFSIINPSILTLEIDTSELKKVNTGGQDALTGTATTPAVSNNACQGFKEYKAREIPSGTACQDSFGKGWVGINYVCCGGMSGAPTEGTQCCALRADYVPEDTGPVSGGSFYTKKEDVPAGHWCYEMKAGEYTCGATEQECQEVGQSETDPAVSQCTKY